MSNKERFLKYLQTCVKSTRVTEANPLLLGGNAPKDYVRFLESDRLFDYNPEKWTNVSSMYDINDYEKALAIFNLLITDEDFLKRDKSDNQGWRRGAISHYICFLSAQQFFTESTPAHNKETNNSQKNTDDPLQQIFYGAPGTGKSHGISCLTNNVKSENVIRTTFHPDSDYSTFVGAYKPTMCEVPVVTLVETQQVQVKDVKGKPVMERRIEYNFVPQAFTQAYIKAWKNLNEPVYLVIEEINRGNCAQIFGDLFQLLDRNDEGYSSYEITPDTDLQRYIAEQGLQIESVTDNNGENISQQLMSGTLMALPPNLHIWATMNTCDQSLFPIDSAFKRRWDWTYVPIKYEKTEWKVVLSDNSWCSWAELQTTLNDLIYDATESEDKMLGDWFVKADDKNEITEEQLVGKIIFYLWNDVAKVDAGKLFDLEVEKRGRTRKVIFSDFYAAEGKINSEVVKNWLKNIEVAINDSKSVNEEEEEGDDDSGDSKPEHISDTNMPYRVTFPDGEVICKGNGWDTYIAALRKIGLDKALPYGEMFYRKNKTLPLITTKRIPDDGNYKYYDMDGYYVLSGTDSQHRLLKRMNKDLNLGLTIE